MNEETAKIRIAKRIALELGNDWVVNLGVGIPTMVADCLPAGKRLFIHSENGILGVGPSPSPDNVIPNLINAGRKPITAIAGASYFDSALSFGMIRGGHIDATVIGALQVSQEGDLANWKVPGKDVLGPGGAMDLVVGAREVVVAMQHVAKDGTPKIVRRCTMPITAYRAVHLLVTEYAMFRFACGRMILVERTADTPLEKIRSLTDADYEVSDDLLVREV
jgi:3-oxoacid CoA-transferase B subunit